MRLRNLILAIGTLIGCGPNPQQPRTSVATFTITVVDDWGGPWPGPIHTIPCRVVTPTTDETKDVDEGASRRFDCTSVPDGVSILTPVYTQTFRHGVDYTDSLTIHLR